MEKQEDLFGSEIGQSFKSDQLTKEDLQFKLSSIEKEVFRLRSLNSRLSRQLDNLLLVQLGQEDLYEASGLDSNKNPMTIANSKPVSWGARYSSKNPEVKDVLIPENAEPDHIYSEDRLNYYLEKKCHCVECELSHRTNLEPLDDLVTRKLILTREKRMAFVCSECGEKGIQKLIEKHLEAELYSS